MRIRFQDVRRPARMAKLVRAAFAAEGVNIGLSRAQDVCARLYGYATYHELKASCVTQGASPWDEAVAAAEAEARRERQVSSLVADGLRTGAAQRFVSESRPTGTARGGGRATARQDTAGEAGRGSPVPAAANPRPTDWDRDFPLIGNGPGDLAERIVARAAGMGTEAVHIEPMVDHYAVYLVRLGERILVHIGDSTEHAALVGRIKDRSNMDPAERRIGEDGAFSIALGDRLVDLTVATTPSVTGEQVLMRLAGTTPLDPGLDGIGIANAEDWRRAIVRRNGLCLIVGEGAPGRRTALNASVRELDRFGKRIYTAEDPVEYRIPFVGQVRMIDIAGSGFAQAIRHLSRADPDVMVLGEVRDEDTARNVVKAAETGHLTVATMQAGSAREAVSRFETLMVRSHELRFLLRGVLVTGRDASGMPSSKAVHIGSSADFDRLYRLPDAGTDDVPTVLVDDAIARMKAGLVTSVALARLFGKAFQRRMAEVGLDPDDYAFTD
jgi:hypothetical protein